MSRPLVIGVDLGGTKLLGGVVDAELQVHHRAGREARGEDGDAVIATLLDAIEELRTAAGGAVAGVGVAVPSLIDQRVGEVVHTVHLPLARVRLAAVLAERLGLPVWLDNDANAAMLAEWRFGAAAGAQDALMLTLGTGIGGGLVVGGALVRGAAGAAGEPGHMTVDLDGPECPGRCPNRGCLEALASGPALAREGAALAAGDDGSALAADLRTGRELTGARVTELAHDGDPPAAEAVRRIGARLGVGIANLVNLLNPEVVVVGGGLVAAGELLLAPARDQVRARALPPSRDMVRIVPAAFGEESGMLGAAALALDGLGTPAAP